MTPFKKPNTNTKPCSSPLLHGKNLGDVICPKFSKPKPNTNPRRFSASRGLRIESFASSEYPCISRLHGAAASPFCSLARPELRRPVRQRLAKPRHQKASSQRGCRANRASGCAEQDVCAYARPTSVSRTSSIRSTAPTPQHKAIMLRVAAGIRAFIREADVGGIPVSATSAFVAMNEQIKEEEDMESALESMILSTPSASSSSSRSTSSSLTSSTCATA